LNRQDSPSAPRDSTNVLPNDRKRVLIFNFRGAKMAETADKPKVLIADDERVIADTLAAILNHGGFEALAAYSSLQALELARVFRPDLLISDVIM